MKRIIFAGTPDFAAELLEVMLGSDIIPIACLTQPDRPKGRGQKLAISPVKSIANLNNIPTLQPEKLTEEVIQQIAKYQPDLIVVVAYGLILPQKLLDLPKFGCINVHTSLLPRWRGAAPIQQAILAGDKETGVTIMQLDAGMDTGDILFSNKCDIQHNETTTTLYEKLLIMAKESLLMAIVQIFKQQVTRHPQNHNLACLANKISKQDANINWNLSAQSIERMIRAYQPWPVAYSFLQADRVRIWQGAVYNPCSRLNPGEIVGVSQQGIDIATGTGTLRVIKLQFPGGKVLSVQDVLNARRYVLRPGMVFTNE